MKAQLTFKFDTFTAVLEDVGDLSDRDEQQKVVDALEFLHALNDDFKRADQSPRQSPVKAEPQATLKRVVTRVRETDDVDADDVPAEPNYTWIPVERILVFNSDGKRGYKVLGGKYTKFGVPLYTDSCKMPQSTFRKLQKMPYGITSIAEGADLHACVEHDEVGRPVRVIELGEL